MKKLISIIVLLSTISTVTFGDRELNRTETLQIFQMLTDQPRNTWIPTGTIEATRLAYKASSGYITNSTVIVKYDGDKFYWEININSHNRETEPHGSSRVDFNLNWNKKRVFAWDGQHYTMYFRPGNHAIVTESPSDIPVVVNGPLTAGIIPWGYGVYTFEELSVAESSAEVDDQGQIHLTLNRINTPELVFVLDPAKDYAVLSHSINDAGRSSISKTYGDYYEEPVSGRWIPTTILIERYDNSKQTPELLTRDYWDINSISVTLPQTDSFDVAYEAGTLVESDLSIIDKPLFYHYSDESDTDALLQERLEIVLTQDTQTQNCATMAMKYVLGQLGKNVTDEDLAVLVSEPNEGTSLYELRQFAQRLGISCLAAKTDIAALKNLNGCQAVLHLPGPNHYVVLEHIDDEYVWIIDLDNNKFYYRTKLDLFELDCSEGTALLISNGPLNDLEGNFTTLSDEQLREIIGGFPNYSCTGLIQKKNIVTCPPFIGMICGGAYYQFRERYGCVEDENGGYCAGSPWVGYVYSLCIENPQNPGTCTVTGDWYNRHMRACK